MNKLSKSNYEHEIIKLYKEILLRDPDKTGLYYFISQLESKKSTLDDIKYSLLNSEEGQSIQNYSHYTDKYWNDLKRVIEYKNELSTDKKNTHWIDDLLNKFSNYIPFENILIVGCGNGWLERRLYDQKIGKNFDAFDISEKYIKEAEEQKGTRPINYFIDDINDIQNIEPKKYDAVFNFAILHHASEIDDALKKLSKCLKSGGLMFNEEYVGPARNQYSEKHLEIMLSINSDLPERLRSKNLLRPPLENFRIEPTEAIHSDLVISTFKKYFDIVFERNMNGGIAYQILWNNISEFEKNDIDSTKWLNFLLEKDIEFTNNEKVPVLFWYGVGQPKL
jgi:2-polyprenyl-3-methyl-5-hydroxy-6-metoxy-1,4-benzoquinol methylase